jgi:siroheme decarboxylase
MTKALNKEFKYKVFNNSSYTSLEKKLINDFQHGFPLSAQPFQEIADTLDVDIDRVLNTYEKLLTDGVISRIGPVIKPNSIGASSLAALSVSEENLVNVAEFINQYAEVNHNYEREHEFNLWFVIAASDKDRLSEIFDEIKTTTACPLLILPLEDAYHIDLGFDLKWNQH